MRSVTVRTGKSNTEIVGPSNMGEVTVELFQNVITSDVKRREELQHEYDGPDLVEIFAILFGTEATGIAESPAGTNLESTLYETISFFLPSIGKDSPLDKLPVPKLLEMRSVWLKDLPDSIRTIEIPKGMSNFSIGQAIQARKSLEGVTDLREALSSITAIYLQPMLDRDKFDMLRVTHWEYVISKMPVTKIYPIAFFLLKKLRKRGSIFTRCWNRIRSWLLIRKKKQ